MSEENQVSLLKELKKEGLNIGEEAVVKVVRAVFAAVPKHLQQKGSPYAPVAAGLLPVLLPHVLAFVDKIDGEDDEEY